MLAPIIIRIQIFIFDKEQVGINLKKEVNVESQRQKSENLMLQGDLV